MSMNLHKGDPVLHERALRAVANLMANKDTGVLERACASGEPLILGLAVGEQRKALVKATTEYGFTLDDGDHHKLEVLYALPTTTAKNLKKVLRRDAQVAALGLRPSVKVRQRLHVSKMILQRLIDESLRARFTLVDGSVIPMRTRSFGFYEINGDVKGDAITLFRHGIYEVDVGDEVLVAMS